MNKYINNEISSPGSGSFRKNVWQEGKKDVCDSDFTEIHWLISHFPHLERRHCCLLGSDCDNGLILVKQTANNQCIWPFTVLPFMAEVTMTWIWQQNSKPRAVRAICVSTVCFFHYLSQLSNTANIKEQNRTVSRALCQQPDVLFRDEFSSLHSALVIYIGSQQMSLLFISLPPPQCKDEYRRRGSYLQFGASIKMLIVGNHFSAVRMEAAPKDSETDGPARIHNPELPKHSERLNKSEMTEEFLPPEVFFFFRKKTCSCILPWHWLLLHNSRCWPDLVLEVSLLMWGVGQGLSINRYKMSLRPEPWGRAVLRKSTSEACSVDVLLMNGQHFTRT